MRRKSGVVKPKLKLYENGIFVVEVDSVAQAKRIIEGCDLSMATVDCDPQEYQVRQGSKVIYSRPRIRIP